MSHSHDHHDHTHGDHTHTPVVTNDNEHKVLVAFFVTFAFMIVEGIGGILSGSLALIADAGHMLTDAGALALAYFAFRFGRKAADHRRTFGYMRFEVIAGFVNAVALLGIVLWIGMEAYQRFRTPHEVVTGTMLAVALMGLLVNLFVLWFLTRGESEHINIRGATLHVMGDLLGSLGAIGAAVAIYFTGWTPIDPILSVVVSLLIVRSAWKLLSNSLHILLEGAPDHATPEMLEGYLRGSVEGVAEVNHVHVWSITSGRTLATLHIRPVDDSDARLVVRRVEHALRERFQIEHATVAIDWNDGGDEDCALSRKTEALGRLDS